MKQNAFSLASLGRILMILAILSILGLNLTMAYIMFAPDSWPKPFYLSYQYPALAGEATHETNAHAQESIPQEASEPVYVSPSEPAPSAPLEIRAGQGLMVDTGAKIVNLAEASGRRYIRVNIILEFAPTDLEYYTMPLEEKNEYVTKFTEDINTRLPVINDCIITLLSSKTFEDVYTATGKEDARQEIMAEINTRLPEYRVIFVYFTEFVVQ